MRGKKRPNIAVFCSGNGTNLEALLRAEKAGRLGGRVALVVCDKPGAFALTRAKRHKKQALLIEPRHYPDRRTFEAVIVKHLKARGIDRVVLAGFMRILSPYFTRCYAGKIVNIHPALLPAFKGAHAIRDAYEASVPVTGVTVHFVTDDLDAGPIILQEEVRRHARDTLARLEARIHRVEHRLYPKAIRLFCTKKLKGKK